MQHVVAMATHDGNRQERTGPGELAEENPGMDRTVRGVALRIQRRRIAGSS